MYNVEHLTKHEWEAFQTSQSFTPDVQSVEYGNFYTKLGEQALYVGVRDLKKHNILAGSLIVTVHAKRGDFLYLPYGPVLSPDVPKERIHSVLKDFFSYLKTYGKKQGFSFIRISPFWQENTRCIALLQKNGLRPAPMHILAETTWLNHLSDKNPEQLLSQMNKNHRNLIRRLEREGAIVHMYTDATHLEKFHALLDETARRHKFTRFSREYIEKEFAAYQKTGKARLFLGYLPDGTLDAGAICYLHGSMAAYRHGASLGQNRKLPVSYLVQWSAIKEALKQGKVWYNFWGIAPSHATKKHPFFGITHFKKGFGGQQRDLIPCHDLPLSWTYWLTWLVESIRKMKRGF